MKKLLLLASLVLCIIFGVSLTISPEKISLDEVKFVTYEVENNDISISSYSTLDKKGVLKVFLKRNNDTAFYKYQLKKDEIESVNKLSSKKLSDFLIKKKFEPGTGYSGSLNYLSFKTSKTNEKICFILPFMDSQFQESVQLLENKIFSQNDSNRISEFNIDFETTKKEILRQQQIDNYLPKKQTLPPPMKKLN